MMFHRGTPRLLLFLRNFCMFIVVMIKRRLTSFGLISVLLCKLFIKLGHIVGRTVLICIEIFLACF